MTQFPNLDQILNAIHSVETRGYSASGKYTALGKPNNRGQRAYGKYQVMDFNIPAWTKEALGKTLTPKQFLNSPEAQEAVARYRIGQLYKKYGNVADVASVWFSGRPVAKAGNAKDATGTSVSQYVAAVEQSMPSSKLASVSGNAISQSLLNAYHNLFGVNQDLHYQRNAQQQPPRPAPPAQAMPKLARAFTPNGRITTPFGGSTTQEPFHPAVDIANKMGTPIPSTVKGVVTMADYGHKQGENNFGNSVIVTDADGNQHRYSHMNQGYVKMGQPVAQGQPIGEFGNTGATYSPSGMGDGTNLDYRIVDAYGQYKNPMLYLGKQAPQS